MPPARLALWLFSFGGVALCVRALWVAPPPLWLAVAALWAYVALATVGVLVPQLEMYGDVFWRGPRDGWRIALTFDDGPHPVTTRRVLELLADRGVVATFFLVGHKVDKYPDVAREIVQAGHAVGLHGYDHDRLYCLKSPDYVRRDIDKSRDVIERVCGERPSWLRPPIGYVSHRTATGAKRAGVELVAWSVRGLDGMGQRSPEQVAERVRRGLVPGAIVMLHDAAEREDFDPPALEALPAILDAMAERRLEAVTIETLAEGKG